MPQYGSVFLPSASATRCEGAAHGSQPINVPVAPFLINLGTWVPLHIYIPPRPAAPHLSSTGQLCGACSTQPGPHSLVTVTSCPGPPQCHPMGTPSTQAGSGVSSPCPRRQQQARAPLPFLEYLFSPFLAPFIPGFSPVLAWFIQQVGVQPHPNPAPRLGPPKLQPQPQPQPPPGLTSPHPSFPKSPFAPLSPQHISAA